MRRALPAALVVVIAALGLNLVTATPASACSCAGDPFNFFDESEVELAFVGTVVDETSLPGFNRSIWTFDVDEVLVGEVGPTVHIRTPTESASCGLSAEEGTAMAVIAFKEGRAWSTISCDTANPSQAIGFGDPRPPDPSIGAGSKYTNRELSVAGAALAGVATIAGLSILGLRRLRRDRT